MNGTEPIATYSLRGLLYGDWTYTLYSDCIEVRGRSLFGNRLEQRIALDTLEPFCTRMVFRPHARLASALVPIAAAIIGTALGCAWAFSGISTPPRLGVPLLGVIAYGIPFLAKPVIFRRVEAAHFLRTTGANGLYLVRTGPEKDTYPVFVDAVLHQIQASRATSA